MTRPARAQLFHVGVMVTDVDAATRDMSDSLALQWKGGQPENDQQASGDTRRRLLADLGDSEVQVFGTHFPSPTSGRIARDGEAYRLLI